MSSVSPFIGLLMAGQRYRRGWLDRDCGWLGGLCLACLGGTAHYFDFYPSGGLPSGTHFNAWSIDLPYATPGNDNRRLGGQGSIGDGTEFVIP